MWTLQYIFLTFTVIYVCVFYISAAKTVLENAQYNQNDIETNESTELYVELSNGRLLGKDNGFYYSYESIPYAEPPVNELRFENPIAYTRKWNGTFDATKKALACMQWDQFQEGDNKLYGVEDCLFVNIYKPKVVANSSFIREKYPVLILIHGGAFMFGSMDANNHDHFMHSGRVILAKISYRVGPLGFLSTEDTFIPGNFGLKDQKMALHWIKQNIEHFGGDPNSMMVLGFSSGGASVHLQMLQKDFLNIAKVAASFSGTALNPWVITRNARKRAFELANILHCPDLNNSQAIKECLKEKPANEIVSAVRKFLIFGYNPFTTFGPVIEISTAEDAFLIKSPEEIIRSGEFTHIPWFVSYTAQEGGYNAAELLQMQSQHHNNELIEMLNERWYDLAPYVLFFKDAMPNIEALDDYSATLKQYYMGNKEFSVRTYGDLQCMYTDILFKNGIEKAVRLHRMHNSSAIYAYMYDNPADDGIGTTLAQRKDIKLGTNHGDDFFLIFHNRARAPQLRTDEEIISKNFVKMLEDFAYDNNELIYGSCKFESNIGIEDFALMCITENACKNKYVKAFP